ncbi:hypothetical protein ACWEJ6_50140 [Nonomuraea sp. NPDC004702]
MRRLKLRRPEYCLGLAEAGLNRAEGHADAQTEALFGVMYAHTVAKTGSDVPPSPSRACTRAHHRRAGDEVPFRDEAMDRVDGVRSLRTLKAVARIGGDLARGRARGLRYAAEARRAPGTSSAAPKRFGYYIESRAALRRDTSVYRRTTGSR